MKRNQCGVINSNNGENNATKIMVAMAAAG
jgi:hypothetical protein